MHPIDPESLFDIIRRRRSSRRFSDDPIDHSQLLRLIEAGIWAPSGSNWQNQRFLLIEDPAAIQALGELRYVWPYKNADPSRGKLLERHPSGIIGKASAVIIVFSDSYENDRRNNGEYHLWQSLETQNCSASIQNILLLATSMKLASCWVSASESMSYTRLTSGQPWRRLLRDFHIPSHYQIQGIILLGHPTSVDADGYPKGEKKHGATVWQSIDRRPISEYMINRKTDVEQLRIEQHSLDAAKRAWLALATRLIRFLQHMIRALDKSIQAIELAAIRKCRKHE